MARAMKNWANVILLAVQVLGPVFSKLGKKKVDKFQSANRETQIKMVRRWAIVSPPLWVALKNKKVAGRVVDFLTSEEGKEIIASGGEMAASAAQAKLEKKMAKKNGREKAEALAKKVIVEMRGAGFPDGYYGPSLWEHFSEAYDEISLLSFIERAATGGRPAIVPRRRSRAIMARQMDVYTAFKGP